MFGSIVAFSNEQRTNSIQPKTSDANISCLEVPDSLRARIENPMYIETINNPLVKHYSGNHLKSQNQMNIFIERNKSIQISQSHSFNNPEHQELQFQDPEFLEEEKPIDIKRRTFEIESLKEEYRYFIIPESICRSCDESVKGKKLKEFIVLHDTELRVNMAVGTQNCPN